MDRTETFDSFSQQVVSHYRQLITKELTLTEHPEGFHGLYALINDLYTVFHERPEAAGFPVAPPLQLHDHEMHSKHKDQKKMLSTYQKPLVDFLGLCYDAGCQGEIVGETLTAPAAVYAKFLKPQKRLKENLVRYVAGSGLKITLENGAVRFTHDHNPDILHALSRFARACADNMGDLSVLCFRRCDFQALEPGHHIDLDAFLRQMLTESEYAHMLPIHADLLQNGFSAALKAGAFDSELEIQYTNPAIKTSPLFAVRYDIRYEHPVSAQMRFVAMTRITPISHLLPEDLQAELFRTANPCGGCGWCKKQKGLLKPSVLRFKDEKKPVCWFNQVHYHILDHANGAALMEYLKLHQQLSALK